jgi:hypothetical protein
MLSKEITLNNIRRIHLSVIKRKVDLVPTSSVIYILDDGQIEKSTLMLDDNMYQTLLKCAELCDFVRDR